MSKWTIGGILSVIHMAQSSLFVNNVMVGAGQLLSNHVAVEIDGNVKCFDREGLRQLQCFVTDEDLAIETICFNCYVIAPQLPHLYQFIKMLRPQ